MPINLVQRGKEGEEDKPVERMITGLHSLDWSFADKQGNAGLPLRNITEITGDEGIGKTSVALSLAGLVAAKYGRNITLIDFERQNADTIKGCLDSVGFNGDVDWCTYIWEEEEKKKTKTRSEDILDISTKKCYQRSPDVIIIDSMAAFTPTAIYEGDLGDANMGIHAKTVKTWFRRTLRPVLSNPDPTVVFYTNHTHPKIGGGFKSFGPPPMESAGGRAVGFLSTQAIDLKRLYGYDYPDQHGWVLEGKIAKNRDGYGKESKNSFYVYMQAGEGINKNLTAMFDCIMSAQELASVTSGVVSLDGQKMQRVTKMIEQRHDNSIFEPFHNALRAAALTPSQPDDDETPKKKSKKKSEEE